MAKAYYSTVFEHPAPAVWKIVRDFNNYAVWVGGAGESAIEDGKSGDTVGAVRNVLYQAAAHPPAAIGAVRRRAFPDLRIRRRADAAGDRLSGHLTNHAGCRWRPRFRRVVGDLRLRRRPARPIDRDPGGR